MIDVIVVFFILALLWLYVVVRLVQKAPKTPKPVKEKEKHVHTWDVWEQGMTNVVNSRGEKLYKQQIQTRKCLSCGYMEKEFIQAQ